MTIILPLACSYAPGLAFIYFCPYSVIDVTVVTKLSTAAHENAHLQSKFIITIYDEFYATVASRARLRSPHMVRVFHAADGDPHALCNTTLSSAAAAARIVMAGWKAIGWIYSWIKQIKFTVHRRVLSAAGCYPPATALLNGTTGSSEFARLAEAGRLPPIQLARYAWLKAEQ